MEPKTEAQALHQAAAYCSTAERCKQEVTERLTRWGMEADAQHRIITRLVEEQFINEERFCKSFVNDKLRFNKWGRIKIAYALKQKQVAPQAILQALSEIDEAEYATILRALIQVKSHEVKGKTDYERTAKLYKFALSRGFEMTQIQQCINPLEDVEDVC